MTRTATIERTTKETHIICTLNLDGSGKSTVKTGLGFLDHMLNALARHSRIDLELTCAGDLSCDDHHTVEDCAIVIAEAINAAVGDGRGIERFGQSFVPMDETLVRCAIDLCGRPTAIIALDLRREKIGDVATENIIHFFRSFANTLRCSLHLDTIRGENDHHKSEAAFKSLARALRDAVALTTFNDIPSTKGMVR
jgi:imidazoleglycerol phosphate dehydratase HisB